MNTESPKAPTPPRERKSSRVATISRKNAERESGNPNAELTIEDTFETEEISSNSNSSSETSESSSDKKKKSKKHKKMKARELIPYVGKGKANMWIETVKGTFNDEIMKQFENLQTGRSIATSKKYQRYDQELYSEVLKALMSNEASPENESTAMFNKLSSHGSSIKRSGLKALILIQETVNGRADTHGTSLIQEALTIRILHNNVDGVVSFLSKFRGTQTKLGSAFPYTWAVETLRARMMSDIGDEKSVSWQLAAASFAQYDAL